MDCEARAEWRGHKEWVVVLRAHPSRPLLVSGGGDCAVRVWDLRTRALLRTLAGHWNNVWGLALDPGGTRLASGSHDRTVKLWDLESGELLRTLDDREMGHVYAVAWDAAGACLASGSSDGRVRVWDAASGTLRHTLAGHAMTISALAAHPDAERDLVASGSTDCTVRLWRFSSGALVHTLAGHKNGVGALAASREWLLAAAFDRSLRVWSWSGICARVIETAGPFNLNSLAWRHSRIVALERDGEDGTSTVRVWDASAADPSAWSCVGSLRGKASSPYGVAAAGDYVICAAPGERRAIALHALRAPRERRRIRRPAARV